MTGGEREREAAYASYSPAQNTQLMQLAKCNEINSAHSRLKLLAKASARVRVSFFEIGSSAGGIHGGIARGSWVVEVDKKKNEGEKPERMSGRRRGTTAVRPPSITTLC